jgi:hypothetical protein
MTSPSSPAEVTRCGSSALTCNLCAARACAASRRRTAVPPPDGHCSSRTCPRQHTHTLFSHSSTPFYEYPPILPPCENPFIFYALLQIPFPCSTYPFMGNLPLFFFLWKPFHCSTRLYGDSSNYYFPYENLLTILHLNGNFSIILLFLGPLSLFYTPLWRLFHCSTT